MSADDLPDSRAQDRSRDVDEDIAEIRKIADDPRLPEASRAAMRGELALLMRAVDDAGPA
jgi:hypothetical protein